MLDVHPPHQAVHGWPDFFVHIATIVVGLVIAVGIEQSVEYVHHRHQVAEVRESLLLERRINVNRFAVLTDEFRRFVPVLQVNLRIFRYLHDHPKAAAADLPGKLDWLASSISFVDTAWKTAQQSTILQYMTRAEVMRDDKLYGGLQALGRRIDNAQLALNNARRFAIVDPDPPHLSLAQRDRQIDLTAEVLLQYALVARNDKNLGSEFAEFKHATTRDDVYGILQATTGTRDQAAIDALGERIRRFEEGLGVESSEPSAPDPAAAKDAR